MVSGTWLIIVPPVSLIQLAPVSLAGWGLREAAMVVVLAGFGVSAAAALAISVLMGLALIVLGLPGGLIWLVDWGAAAATPDLPPNDSEIFDPEISARSHCAISAAGTSEGDLAETGLRKD